MERDGNVLVAIIERQAERARAPSRWDGTERKRHRFFDSYCTFSIYRVYHDHKHTCLLSTCIQWFVATCTTLGTQNIGALVRSLDLEGGR